MKAFIKILLFLFIGIQDGLSQDSAIILSQRKFGEDQLRLFEANRLILLSPLDGWIFRQGNDSLWANRDLNTSGWMKLKPTELSARYADKSGKAEGWFRIRLKIDHDLANMRFGLRRGGWAATDIYVDGALIASFGKTAVNEKDFREYNPTDKPSVPFPLEVGREYSIAIHFVDYLSSLPPFKLKSGSAGGVRRETRGLDYLLMLAGPGYDQLTTQNAVKALFYRSVWVSVTLLLALLFWLLAFLNPNEKKTLLPIALYSSFSAVSNVNRFYLTDTEISFNAWRAHDLMQVLCIWLVLIFSFIIITNILNFKLSRNFKYVLLAYYFVGGACIVIDLIPPFFIINTLIGFLALTYILISSWKKLKGAQWAIAGGVALSILIGAILGITTLQNSVFGRYFLLTSFYFSFPISLVLYVSLRFREIIRDVRENAKQVVKLSEEKKQQALNQQAILEQQVKERTAELSQSLNNLRSTQSQLIQSEKMASLGQLTAGIAHEIQNPLNFVNNFSEVSNELIDEMKSELATGGSQSEGYRKAMEIADDIKLNLDKINHHGKRADAIVKGMLQHSRTSSGQNEPTDVNSLADEYLRLAYHGFKAKDKSFNVTIKTEFDHNVGKVNIIRQDIGRVILNLINNAFYAVNEKQKENLNGFEPTVTVITAKQDGKIEIKVKDNGNGIPQKILDKIFQPFFTTKPTGQGTGLGLSLSYDIITSHGGELKVHTNEGDYAEFIVILQTS